MNNRETLWKRHVFILQPGSLLSMVSMSSPLSAKMIHENLSISNNCNICDSLRLIVGWSKLYAIWNLIYRTHIPRIRLARIKRIMSPHIQNHDRSNWKKLNYGYNVLCSHRYWVQFALRIKKSLFERSCCCEASCCCCFNRKHHINLHIHTNGLRIIASCQHSNAFFPLSLRYLVRIKLMTLKCSCSPASNWRSRIEWLSS